MDKLECPRCKNKGLKGTENYCPICGLALKGTAQEVPVQEQSKFIPEDGNGKYKSKEKCSPNQKHFLLSIPKHL